MYGSWLSNEDVEAAEANGSAIEVSGIGFLESIELVLILRKGSTKGITVQL